MTGIVRKVWLAGLLACIPWTAGAQSPAAIDMEARAARQVGGDIIDMGVVTVSGVQPGPGLWRVRRGDHTLYILGTQSPLPRDMQWRADEVREVLAEAGIALGPPGVRIGADIGFFRGLTMLPSAMRASRNPDGARLDTLLPPDLYQRWATLKQRYVGRDRGIERKRPLIAVYELYREALEANGLRMGGVVTPVVDEVLKPRGMALTPTTLEVKVDDPRQALADFRKEGLKPEDLACVRGTLDIIEHGLPQVAARANAWAVGDLDALRATAGARSQVEACLSAWLQTDTARKRGFSDLGARVRARWIEAADKALDEHAVSFAGLPLDDLLGSDGYMDALRPLVDTVLAPDEPDVVEQDDGNSTPDVPDAR